MWWKSLSNHVFLIFIYLFLHFCLSFFLPLYTQTHTYTQLWEGWGREDGVYPLANRELLGRFRQRTNSLALENSFGLCAEGPGRAGMEAERPCNMWPALEVTGMGKRKETWAFPRRQKQQNVRTPTPEAWDQGVIQGTWGKEGQIWGEGNCTSLQLLFSCCHLESLSPHLGLNSSGTNTMSHSSS